MTETPTKIVVDCSTGIAEELPLTAEEIAQREADTAAYKAEQEVKAADDAAKAIAKAALLDRLGISEAEAKLLLS